MTFSEPAGFPALAVRRAVWILVAVHLPFVVVIPVTAVTRQPGMPPEEALLIAVMSLTAGGIQFRHSLAAARRARPRGWPLSFAALIVLALVPGFWFLRADVNWALTLWFVIASALMLLPRRPGLLVAAATVLGAVGWVSAEGVRQHLIFSLADVLPYVPYYTAIFALGGTALYGSARLVAIVTELYAARTEVAELALTRERLRVSRDLHDLLGQSLSAVSLKGDLAGLLLATDPAAAGREIQSLTGIARSALRDMRAVTLDEHVVSLSREAAAAQTVLAAAGVSVTLRITVPDVAPGPEAILAWAVREGATNILRHSHAASATISGGREDGRVWLEIVNDGAPAEAGEGSGLAGLADRARAAGGTMTAGYDGGGRFRLRVEIPEGAP